MPRAFDTLTMVQKHISLTIKHGPRMSVRMEKYITPVTAARFLWTNMKSLIIGIMLVLAVVVSPAVPVITATAQTATTTPPAQQPTNDGVLILGSSQISTDFGSTYIVGEVRNNLSDVVEYVQLERYLPFL
jgi:hypothetical protein